MSVTSRMYAWLARQAEKSELECRRVELSLLEEDPGAKLLDLGCGDGSLTLELAVRVGTTTVYGVDIVDDNVSQAKAKGIEAYQGDLNRSLPFTDNSFDVIVASHVFEHLANTDTFVKEIYRVLKDKGYCIMATPNLAALHHIFFLLFGRQPTIVEISDQALVGTWSPRGKSVNRTGPAHRRVPTLLGLKGLLEYYGFKVEKSIGSGFFPLPGQLAKVMSCVDKRHATNIVIKARKPDKRTV